MDRRILVVDDEKIIRELTSMILRARGFEVLTAENGEAGMALIEEQRPAVVLLDYMMPYMDGLTALKKIREGYPETYVIMFTGKGSEEIAVELMKAGASDYILKPFNNQDLIDRLETVLRIRKIELNNKELRQERERLLREIEEWNRELERRVAEKSRELEQAHAEIVQGEKLVALGHLSAGMAHEIRNPLNTISLFMQLLKNGLEPGSEPVSYVDKALKEVDRIDDILINLLASSKRPRFELHMQSLPEIIDQVLEGFAEQIRAYGVTLNKTFATMPPPILADGKELEQVFNNILANALYEMQQGGTLDFELRHDNQAIYVTISDTGAGIPEEHLHHIFDPFYTTKSKGTGCGLSVVLRIVKTYGGRIWVESVPGQGTTFHVQLPLE
ncbi:response regulator [Desulfuromonas acetexigens]|uniref:histidine kinase n=1 Tax=Trichloromonas acetexigens TaxID=38815 RepID=A0A550JD87_9BACT|nr:response regulator [Desulfuromonas acetexigens]TRO81169.1 response regulator [Desulfuromonas acetexigens]